MTTPPQIRIERLQIRFGDTAGALHRLRPVTARAVAILAELVRENPPASVRHDALDVPPVRIDWARVPDDVAARLIATATYDAMTRRTAGGR